MRDGVSLGFASYFNYAGFIADHILEAGLIIKICEEKGAPNSIEEREVIQKVVRETVNSVMNEQHNQS